jgi:hypothetical protein
VNDLRFSSDGTHLIAAVGQEHKLGRWSTIKSVKNTVSIIKLDISAVAPAPAESELVNAKLTNATNKKAHFNGKKVNFKNKKFKL